MHVTIYTVHRGKLVSADGDRTARRVRLHERHPAWAFRKELSIEDCCFTASDAAEEHRLQMGVARQNAIAALEVASRKLVEAEELCAKTRRAEMHVALPAAGGAA